MQGGRLIYNIYILGGIHTIKLEHFTLEKLKIYETCNFHVNLDLQDL